MIVTIDLEYDWESNETNSLYLVPKLLDFFDDYDIRATFFILGKLIKNHESIIKEIAKNHEIASHGFSHINLKKADLGTLEKEILLTKKILSDLKIECVGFRSPYFLLSKNLGMFLEKNGYVYDSSVSNGVLWGRYNNSFMPKKPYYLYGKVIEIPVSNFSFLKMPFGLPFIRLARKFHLPLTNLNKSSVFYMHPYELLETKPGKEIPFFYRQLYKINIGDKAWNILEDFFSSLNCKFETCKSSIREFEKYEK